MFTEAEEQQLQQLLGFSETDLHTVLNACAYMYEQTAYRNANGEALRVQLMTVGVEEERVCVVLLLLPLPFMCLASPSL
jgi:hypothetical protein